MGSGRSLPLPRVRYPEMAQKTLPNALSLPEKAFIFIFA
jgi:hypothetical protein